MHETITLSFSHSANHTVTHLYNNQESHLSYKKGVTLQYANDVFLTSTKSALGGVNYNPRAILYDLNGGVGALGKYDYYEPEIKCQKHQNEDGLENHEVVEDGDIFKTLPKVQKNEFQRALDMGKVGEGLLLVENTRYWSDYNKLIYKPQSLNTLANWVHVSQQAVGHSRHGRQRKFDTYDVGTHEYKESGHSRDETDHTELFRVFLEDCDQFQGANIFTEADSGWGGFTSSFLLDIKDEFFNNGELKHNFWTWPTYSDAALTLQLKLSRVKTTLELIKHSTLVFAVADTPTDHGEMIDASYERTSMWHSSALRAMLLDNMWSVNNQIRNAISMNQIESELLRGNAKRNIVAEINVHGAKDLSQDAPNHMSVADMYNIKPEMTAKLDFTATIYNNDAAKVYSKSYITPMDFEEDRLLMLNQSQLERQNRYAISAYSLLNQLTITDNYTFPEIMKPDPHQNFAEFGISSKPKDLLKDYNKFLQRSSRIHGRGNFNVEYFDLDEMIEETSNLIEEYVYEWDDDDDIYE
jgi:hypothetical protein